MKTIIWKITLAIFLAIVISCVKDDDQLCDTADPLELDWMTGLKMQVEESCSTCEISLFQAKYKRKSVFYTSMTAPACNSVFSIDLLNCNGELIREFDSSQQESFYEKVTDRQVIYRCE